MHGLSRPFVICVDVIGEGCLPALIQALDILTSRPHTAMRHHSQSTLRLEEWPSLGERMDNSLVGRITAATQREAHSAMTLKSASARISRIITTGVIVRCETLSAI
jgi:hypothetical protein